METPHEYVINIIDDDKISITINDYTLKSPDEEGVYTYSVCAKRYDKGDIIYKFILHVTSE